jgi:hypothetical protein
VASSLLVLSCPQSFFFRGEQDVIRVLARGVGVCAVVAALAAVWSIPGEAQGRRGGPSDWSHARIMAARFGPDGDRNIGKNWRSARKQMQLQWAQQVRDAQPWWFDPIRGRGKQSEADAPHLDWSLRTGGYGNVVGSPAKYSFDISTYSCTDVIYFTVDQAGTASAPNVIAITNAYAGCTGNATGTTPTVKFGIAL